MDPETLPLNTPVIVAFYTRNFQKSPNLERKGRRLGVYSVKLNKEEFKQETRAWAISSYEEMTLEKLNMLIAGTEDYFDDYEVVSDSPF